MASPRDVDGPGQEGIADAHVLARGGRINFLGFLLRLSVRFPFLLIAARLYGADELGRFAYAVMVVEFMAALATLGLKRGLSGEMARPAPLRPRDPAHVLADAWVLGLLAAAGGTALLLLAPGLMFPDGAGAPGARAFALIVPAIVLADLSLAALAFRHRIDVAVRARSVIEPWVLTLAATALAFTAWKANGLLVAYALSLLAAAAASLAPAFGSFGHPRGWRPSPARLAAIAWRNLPLAGADLVEWGSRRLDLFILGRFAPAEVVGLYFVAQQVASLAGKIRSAFDPILAPMLARALKGGDRAAAAGHLNQVGFWVLALQLPVVLALGLAAEGVLGLFGPAFAAGGLVLALLLAAELAAAPGSLSEIGLIYVRPKGNLALALGGLALQAVLSLALVPRFGGEGAAAALLIALVSVAVARQLLLGRVLGAAVGYWRWSLLGAGAATFALGLAARQLPELWLMLAGIPAMLLLFAALVWRFGFGPEDRALFRVRG